MPTIGIIGGKGQMGKLFADFFRERGIQVIISDLGTKLSNTELAQTADITIVSVPMDRVQYVIQEILPFIKKYSALMDLTSVKQKAVDAMLKGKCEVLGLHPMFGSTNPIPGQTIIFCPTKKSGKWSNWLEKFLLANQVKIEHMTPRHHDKMMNVAQGLIHFTEIVFSDALRRCNISLEQLLKFTGKASELKVLLAARILAQDASLYGNIQIQNPVSLASLKQFKKSTDELYKIIAKKNLPAFKKYFERDQKFFAKYLDQAYKESTHLIDCLLENRKTKSKSVDAKSSPSKLSSPKSTSHHIALLGPALTYSDLVADKHLTTSHEKLKKFYCKEIDEVFELVEKGKVKEGIVPVENKLHGTIRETLDNLFERKVHITQEIQLPINHCLVTLASTKKSAIKKIISHSQALSQCKKYLSKHFTKVHKEPVASTTAALELLLASQDPHLAIIASQSAATSDASLQILATKIQDNPDNLTKFYVIQKSDFKSTKENSKNFSHPKNSAVAFHFDKDSPGSLFTVFQDFAAAKINLTRIESRPTKSAFGDYIFYLDFDGTPSDPKVQKTLTTLSRKVAFLKILGTY